MYDLIIKNAKVLSFDAKDSMIDHANVIIDDGVIIDITQSTQDPPQARKILDHQGRLLTPGLIDCHTHIIYGGNRAHEFEMRLQGKSYQEIANAGGGILSTVKATRNASFEALFSSAKERLTQMQQFGTTTCEIKSGYGLDFDTEIKMLQVAKELNKKLDLNIIPSFLAAHALPPGYQSKDAYIDHIIDHMLPKLAELNLCQFVDGFCETIGFSANQIQRLFQRAQALGFKLKLHAEQLSDQKGAALAASMDAYSVDHLEHLSEKDIPTLKAHNTVAVLLPGAYYFLKETKKPPVKALLSKGVDIAIATDANPGSSPFLSLPLMMNMACTFFNLTPYEAFKGVTINAAKALDIDRDHGSIEVGKKADMILWNCHHYNEIIYNATYNYRERTVLNGVLATD